MREFPLFDCMIVTCMAAENILKLIIGNKTIVVQVLSKAYLHSARAILTHYNEPGE